MDATGRERGATGDELADAVDHLGGPSAGLAGDGVGFGALRFRHAADRLYAALRRGRNQLAGDDLSPARIALLEPLLDAPELGVGRAGRCRRTDGDPAAPATRPAGVVSRRRDPADDRRVLVTLTKTGRTRLTAARRTLRRRQTGAYGTLAAAQRDELSAVTARLVDLIEHTIAAT